MAVGQFDTILESLSGEETLYLYGRLRGVPSSLLKRDVDNLIQMTGLEPYCKASAQNYSGGNKRKLSLAIALMSNPSILFLDEPTSGVDPAARRKIWTLLGNIKRNRHSSIVLTSHSMDECEALCNRLAIMVNGTFRCLGTIDHLREKYCQGFLVMIKLAAGRDKDEQYKANLIDTMTKKRFANCELRDFRQLNMDYQINDPNQCWSKIFSEMSKLDKEFRFDDYVISGTSLEQIFIMFAQAQRSVATAANKK